MPCLNLRQTLRNLGWPQLGLALMAVVQRQPNLRQKLVLPICKVAYVAVTGAVTIPAPKGEGGFVVNGRLAMTDINVGEGIATLSVWARNLLNEEHIYSRSLDVRAGMTGFINEPRTFGVEIKVKM